MGEYEFDMEVTPKREEYMKNLLLRLWADQNNVNIKDMVVTVQKQSAKEFEDFSGNMQY